MLPGPGPSFLEGPLWFPRREASLSWGLPTRGGAKDVPPNHVVGALVGRNLHPPAGKENLSLRGKSFPLHGARASRTRVFSERIGSGIGLAEGGAGNRVPGGTSPERALAPVALRPPRGMRGTAAGSKAFRPRTDGDLPKGRFTFRWSGGRQ
jgi:hypothetical protein